MKKITVLLLAAVLAASGKPLGTDASSGAASSASGSEEAVHYNDSSVAGGVQWQEWVENWEAVASDYTNVSLTPGAGGNGGGTG